MRIGLLLADAGYDCEASHVLARRLLGCRTLIPPLIGRPTGKPPSGYWRRRMSQRFDKAQYGQRWQVETVNSMIKRRLGSALGATGYWSQCREMFLRAIVHNVMILWHQLRGFLRSTRDPVSARTRTPAPSLLPRNSGPIGVRMALEAIVNREDVVRVVLEEYPEGVYVLVYGTPDDRSPCEDHLQDDWVTAKRAAFQDYGITDDMWKEIPDTRFNG